MLKIVGEKFSKKNFHISWIMICSLLKIKNNNNCLSKQNEHSSVIELICGIQFSKNK